VLLHPDQSFGICREEILCMKLDKIGSIIYQLVLVRLHADQKHMIKVEHLISRINTLQLRWNLIAVKTDEPFQHLNFHIEWWDFMITNGTKEIWMWHCSSDFVISLTAGSAQSQAAEHYILYSKSINQHWAVYFLSKISTQLPRRRTIYSKKDAN